MLPPASPLLSAQGLAVWRGDRRLMADLDLAVAAGESLWVRGPNGAGKTSLLRVLAGLAPADAGVVYWAGRPLHGAGPERLADLAWLGHQPGLKRGLSVGEALDLEVRLAGHHPDPDARTAALAEYGLDDLADRAVDHLSAGQRRRVALARLSLSAARLWLLDEPYTHLDAEAAVVLGKALARHLDRQGSAVLVSHQAPDIPGHAARVLSLAGGRA